MAKRSQNQSSSDADIKKLLESLYKIVQTTNSSSKEQIRINRELLKTMAVLQSGFAKNEDEARKLIDDVRDGLELNDEYAKKWLKKMGATDKKIDEIVDKFRDIEKIDMDLIDNSEDYLDLLDKRYDVLDDTFDLTKRLLTNHDAITRSIKASKDVAMKLAGPLGDVDSILRKMVAKKVDVSSMFDGLGTGIDRAEDAVMKIQDDISGLINNVGGSIVDIDLHFSPLTDDLDREIKSVLESIDVEKKARLDGLAEYFDVNKKLQDQLSRSIAAQMSSIPVTFDIDTGQISTATGILERGSEEYQKMIQNLDDIASKNNITDKLKVDFKEIVDLMSSGVLRTEEQNKRLNDLLIPMDLATKMLIDQIDQQTHQEQIAAKELMTAKDRYKLMGSYLNQLQTAESVVLKIGAGFDNLNAIMPTGIGEFLGLSKVSAQLIESHKKGVQAFAGELEKGVSQADALKSYYQELTPALKSALNPMTILVTSTVLLFKFVSNITEKYKELSAQLHTSIGQSKKLYETQLDILTSQKNQFGTMEDIAEAQAAMISTGSRISDLSKQSTKDLTISLIETGKAFGYGTTKAVELHKEFKAIGADDSLAKNLQQNLGLLSEAAGISPQIITDDLIDSAETVSTYFAGMPIEAAKAAIKVRQLGMSLKQAGSIAQKMLNLEGFMTDMYELQAMSNGGIDFSRAFDKGLMGDIEGMTEDIMNNIGTTAEYNKMDYLTRTKIASTLGMSVDELAKSVMLHEQMQGMSAQDQKYLQGNLDRMGDISAASQDEIRNRMQQLQATDRLGVAWDKIKGVLIKSLLPAVELIADAIDAISPLVDILVLGLKGVGGILKIIFPIVKGLLFPFKIIGSIIEKITSATDAFAGSLSGVSGILDGIGKVAYVVGAAIGTIFAVRNIGSFFSFITGGFGSVFKTILSIVPALTGSIGSIFSMLTGIPVNLSSTASSASKTVSDSANESIANTKNIASSAVKELNDVAANATTTVKTASESAASGINAAVGSVSIDPIKSASTEAVTEITKASKKSIDTVKTAAAEASNAVEKVKVSTKKGFFSSDKSKSVFKAIGAIGATTFATLAVKASMAFFKAGEDGKMSMANMADSAGPLLESGLAMAGPLLFESLSSGFEKFVRKRIEDKLEKKFEPALKSVRKGLESLGDPAVKSLEKVGERGKGIMGKMFDGIKKVAPKQFGAVTGALQKVTSKLGKGGGLFSKIFGKIPEIPVQEVKQTVDSIGGSIDQVQNVIPEIEDVSKTPIEQTIETKEVVEKTIKPTKGIEPDAPKTIKSPKMEPIDTKSIEQQGQKTQGSITKIFKSIEDSIKSVWSSIKSGIQEVIQTGIDIVKQIATGIVDVAKVLINGVKDISGKLFDIVKSASKTLKSILGDVIDFGVKAMKQIASGIGDSAKSIMNVMESIFGSIFKILKSASSTLKSILGDIIEFASKSMKQLSSGIGASIKNVLTGIADGLSSFKSSALVGAAALVVLSGALWVSSKAIQNFASTKWEDVAKAGVVLGGLVVAGLALGSASPAMLLGSIAMAALAGALYVTGTALEKFNGIEWSSLAKAGVALVGFGIVAAAFGAVAPIVAIGAATIGLASASITLFAGSLILLTGVLSSIDPKPIISLSTSLSTLTAISVVDLLALSGALVAVGASITAFSAMKLGSSITSSISNLFANDLLTDLEKLAFLANPLQIAANAIQMLGASLSELATVMNSVDLSKIDDLVKVGKISVEQKMYDQIQAQLRDVESMPHKSNPEVKVIPVPQPAPKVQVPRKEAVAQNVKIVDGKQSSVEAGVQMIPAVPMLNPQIQGQKQNNTNPFDIYNRPDQSMTDIKLQLKEITNVLLAILKKDVNLNMDSYKVNQRLKVVNNK